MWIAFSLLSGALGTLLGVSMRSISLRCAWDGRVVVFAQFAYAAIFCIPIGIFLIFSRGIFVSVNEFLQTPLIFWGVIFIEAAAYVSAYQAVKRAPLSRVIPFFSLIPVFLVAAQYFMTGAIPNASGLAGIFSVVAGILFANERKGTAQSKSFWIFALLTAILWSATTTIQKISVQTINPALFGTLYFLGIAFVLGAYAGASRLPVLQIFDCRMAWLFAGSGFVLAANAILQFFALQIASPPYVIALKMSMGVLYLLWDRWIFAESLTWRRISGNVLAIGGAIVIILGLQ